MSMTPRERVLAAIEHRAPDRLPIDLGGMRSTGIAAIAYAKVRKSLGLEERPVRVYDMVQQLALPDEDVLDLVETDVIPLERGFLNDPADWVDWPLPDGSPARAPRYLSMRRSPDGTWEATGPDGLVLGTMPPGVVYFSQSHWPMADGREAADAAELARWIGRVIWAAWPTAPWHLGIDAAALQQMADAARRLRQSTDRAIMAAFGGNLLEWGQYLCRFDNFMTDLAGNPRRVHRLLDQLTELHLANLEKFLTAVGPYIDLIQMGDDLGGQQGPLLSPKTYREFFKPRHAAIYSAVKRMSNAKVFLHSCGSLIGLIPDLIEAGVEVLNPVQTSGRGMDPDFLKREYGKELCFWGGGVDTQHILARGTPEEVRADVRRRIGIFRPGGGFVFNTIHNIQANVPVENILALWDEAKRQR